MEPEWYVELTIFKASTNHIWGFTLLQNTIPQPHSNTVKETRTLIGLDVLLKSGDK